MAKTDALLAELGLDFNDPEAAAAWEDAEAAARLVESLVSIRKSAGISQRDVASRMGTTQSAISDLERIAGDPRISTIQRFGRAVGVKVNLTVSTPKAQYQTHRVVTARGSADTRAFRGHIRWTTTSDMADAG